MILFKVSALEIVSGGMNSTFISSNDFMMLGEIALSFDKQDAMPGIQVIEKENDVFIQTALPIRYLPMTEMVEARRMVLRLQIQCTKKFQ